MIEINGQNAVNISYMKFNTLEKFNAPFLINALKGDNLYSVRANSYKVNANEYKNALLKSLGAELKANDDNDLLYIYADKHNVPESLCVLDVNDNNELKLKHLLIKRDNIRLFKEFILIAKEIVTQLYDTNSFMVEVPLWNLKLEENLIEVVKELNFKIENVGTLKSSLYAFEDKYNTDNKETTIRDTVTLFKINF